MHARGGGCAAPMHQRGAHTYYPAALFWEASRTILHYSHRGGVRLLVAGPAQAEFGTPFNAARRGEADLRLAPGSPPQPATACRPDPRAPLAFQQRPQSRASSRSLSRAHWPLGAVGWDGRGLLGEKPGQCIGRYGTHDGRGGVLRFTPMPFHPRQIPSTVLTLPADSQTLMLRLLKTNYPVDLDPGLHNVTHNVRHMNYLGTACGSPRLHPSPGFTQRSRPEGMLTPLPP